MLCVYSVYVCAGFHWKSVLLSGLPIKILQLQLQSHAYITWSHNFPGFIHTPCDSKYSWLCCFLFIVNNVQYQCRYNVHKISYEVIKWIKRNSLGYVIWQRVPESDGSREKWEFIWVNSWLQVSIFAGAVSGRGRGFSKDVMMWDLHKFINYLIKVSWLRLCSRVSHPKCSSILVTLESLVKSLQTNLAAFRCSISTA